MDRTAIKNYAVTARKNLIEAVKLKAQQLYIFEDNKKTLSHEEMLKQIQNDGIYLSDEQKRVALRLYSELWREGYPYSKELYNRVIENVAYTWFNRLIALRFLEVNDYLPSNIRILSSQEPGRMVPDALREVERLDYVNQAKVAELLADTDINASEKLYKYILISQCNALAVILPGMFEKENDYTELLLPDSLYQRGGIVYDLLNAISEDDFKEQVQIIGWLYQYYISEKKDEVFAGLKKNIKINKDTIPAATQLFTPEWIVKYMVENSLGRLWLETHPNADLRSKWEYYVDEAEQDPEVAEQLNVLRSQSPVKRPEDIRLIDPCMGSGHILVYAFDVLFQIYQSEGYSEREIPNLILQNNLYGLDIDDRAGQLAYFALMMKARSYNRRFFRQDNIPQPFVYAIPETKLNIFGLEKWLGAHMNENDKKTAFEDLKYLVELFDKGKDYGSALKIGREIDFDRLRKYIHDFKAGQIDLFDTEIHQAENLDRLIDVAAVLVRKYDVVVTNPPYMGNSGMSATLAEYVKKNYPNSKSDMSTVFMEKTLELCNPHGYMSMINIPVWMFITSYEGLREIIIANNTIVNLLHFGRGIFGADFGTTAFTFCKKNVKKYITTYRKLYFRQGSVDSVEQKERWFFEKVGEYFKEQDKYLCVPGKPIAYTLSDMLLSAFEKDTSVSKYASPKQGMSTCDVNKFVKYWFELDVNRTNIIDSNLRCWVKYNKGGEFRKWYGNREHFVYWGDDGNALINNNAALRNRDVYFKRFLAWTKVTISTTGFRWFEDDFLFDGAGGSLFVKNNDNSLYILAGLNSVVSAEVLKIISPTVNYNENHIGAVPMIIDEYKKEDIEKYASENIDISRTDWDSFETSWDFKRHPLLTYHAFTPQQIKAELQAGFHATNTMKDAFKNWDYFSNAQFARLKSNEEELNRIFIDIYGLQDELTPEVEDKDVTVRKADLARDIRSFISYAVGCMFGRYSLDEAGLVFAGGKFDMSRYTAFKPVEDNIIPINHADYFDNDIVLRFVEFVRTVYGENTLGENISFIADVLYPNGNGTAQERIRRYFLNDFYKDHLKIYQKRPIYWLLDSGKKDGFKALFYLHRHDKFTIARARTDYLHPLQRKYDGEIKRLESLSADTENARDKAAIRKEIEALQNKMDECRIYDQVVSHIAHQQITLDLDDGVKVNYEKFQGVEVPKDNGKTETMDLLGRI